MWHRLSSYFATLFPPKEPDRAFSRRVRHRIHALTSLRVPAIDDADFSLHTIDPSGGTLVLFLGNLFHETQNAPDQAEARIDLFIHVLTQPKDEPWAIAKDQLLPVLRNTTFGGELTNDL